jgi:hypothetical protein
MLKEIGSMTSATASSTNVSAPSEATELPLREVTLSSAGLAQFTRAGRISPGSTVGLEVKLDQVDDILQSLTIFDEPKSIGVISLPGKTPLAEAFRDLPFGQGELASRADLLKALVGANVEIGGGSARGVLLAVEREVPESRHRISLMTERGLQQFVLEETSELRLLDPRIVSQIGAALSAVAANRVKNSRMVSVVFAGEQERTVALSYVVAAPIWKTSYRLVLPTEGDTVRVQGWAVVENLTGAGWKDVDLTLTSGSPVTLKQQLYTPVFAQRHEVAVASNQAPIPQVDDGNPRERGLPPRILQGSPAGMAEVERRARAAAMGAGSMASASIASASDAAAAEDTATLFTFRMPTPVTLAAGNTVLLPFVDRELTAKRVWLYQPETSKRHPLAAVRIRNDSESGLPAGIVTAYDASGERIAAFAGHAQLPLLPKGASKFVTFALDPRTEILRVDQGVFETRIATVVNGAMVVKSRVGRSVSYSVTPPADEDRLVVIEEPQMTGWKTVTEMTNLEEGDKHLRFEILAEKGQRTTVVWTTERSGSDIVLSGLPAEKIITVVDGLRSNDSELNVTISRITAAVEGIAHVKRQRDGVDHERKQIEEEQARIRTNLQSVGNESDLGRRYIGQMKAQEDQLAELSRSARKLDDDLSQKRDQLEAMVRNLKV